MANLDLPRADRIPSEPTNTFETRLMHLRFAFRPHLVA